MVNLMRIIEQEEKRCCIYCDILLAYTKDDILYSYYEYKDDHEIDRTIFKYIKCPKCHRHIQVGSIDTNMTEDQFTEKYKGHVIYVNNMRHVIYT